MHLSKEQTILADNMSSEYSIEMLEAEIAEISKNMETIHCEECQNDVTKICSDTCWLNKVWENKEKANVSI